MTMYAGKSSADLFHYIAPDFAWQPIHQHLRNKFMKLKDSVFERQLQEFLKFIFLRSRYGKGFIPVAHEIDALWHEFILQTKEYEKFCLSLPGKHFIHHNSIALEDYDKQEDRDETVRNLLNWIPNYMTHFGPFSNETARYWLMVEFLKKEMRLSLDEINQLQ